MTTESITPSPPPADAESTDDTGASGQAVSRSGSRPRHEPPAGADTRARWSGPDGDLGYAAHASWTVLREADEPVAEMFSVSYLAGEEGADPDVDRPVTFVFNGGPGASSAYLHVGALGPQRVAFNDDGTAPPPPSRLVPNEESWLGFSDLVFIDPIGTGFSRLIKDDGGGKGTGNGDGGSGAASAGPDAEKKAKRFFAFQRDLDSIGEFIRRWLTAHGRWGSPVFIAGESYGGYRVARLAKLLPEKYGVGLNGVVIISPALEFGLLVPNDYSIEAWVDLLPTMAAAAHQNGLGRDQAKSAPMAKVIAAAEKFATTDYVAFLAQGASMPAKKRDQVLTRFADLTGLDRDLVERAEGRIPIRVFVRELRGGGEVVGLYDASMVSGNPFPDRDGMTWPDPTLSGIERIFAAGANQQIRGTVGVDTDREYLLLSHEVNQSWGDDGTEKSWVSPPQGAVDDLRYALALSPHTRYFLCHGRFDLVTPYHSSDRLVNLMRLRESDAERITTQHFLGGHMFYTWTESRRAFRDAMVEFYREAIGL